MTPLSKMTEEQCELWGLHWGTYEDMIGRGLVTRFDYMGTTFKIGAIVDVRPGHNDRLTVEVLAAGTRVRNRKWVLMGSSRRAIIVRVVEADDQDSWDEGQEMSISLWEPVDEPHIRHNALFGLANI